MNIILDFDGTCVTHVEPGIGEDIGAIPVLKELVNRNHNLILFTMRPSGEALNDAISWFWKNNIRLHGIQKNPHQSTWTDSPKAYGDLIIDDTALGIPLIFDETISDRPFVNWFEVRRMLVGRGLL
jgi:hypothetical protein